MKLKTKFQDEDFDLGEVVEANVYHGGSGRIKVIAEPTKGGMITFYFETLKELNEMFEDVPEEPKKYWWISDRLTIYESEVREDTIWHINICKEIGNYFETREEAELAVRKLKAWKRLKDTGFRFEGWTIDDGLRISICTNADSDGIYDEYRKEVKEELDTCFGGEE